MSLKLKKQPRDGVLRKEIDPYAPHKFSTARGKGRWKRYYCKNCKKWILKSDLYVCTMCRKLMCPESLDVVFDEYDSFCIPCYNLGFLFECQGVGPDRVCMD